VRESLDRFPWVIDTILKLHVYQMVLHRPIECTALTGQVEHYFMSTVVRPYWVLAGAAGADCAWAKVPVMSLGTCCCGKFVVSRAGEANMMCELEVQIGNSG